MDIRRITTAILCFCFLVSVSGLPASAELSEIAEDKIEVFIRLRVSHHSETHFKAGDPPKTVRNSSEVSFTMEGEWTFYRIKEEYGGGYFAFPRGGEVWPVTDVSATENHTCLNDEGMVIGENAHHSTVDGSPAPGGVSLHMGEDGKLRLRLNPTRIDTKVVRCKTQHCIGSFGGGFNAGENYSGKDLYGHDIAVIAWDSLKKQQEWPAEYDDGLPPLVPIPFSFTSTHRSGNENERHAVTYSVISWISGAGGEGTIDSADAPGIGDKLTQHEKRIGIPVYPGLECAGFVPAGGVPAGGETSLPIISGFTDDPLDRVLGFFTEKLSGWRHRDGHIRCFVLREDCDITKPEITACVHVRVHPPAYEGQPVVVQYFYEENRGRE